MSCRPLRAAWLAGLALALAGCPTDRADVDARAPSAPPDAGSDAQDGGLVDAGVAVALDGGGDHEVPPGQLEPECGLVGCVSGMDFTLPVDRDPTPLFGARIRACRNDTCFESTFERDADPTGVSASSHFATVLPHDGEPRQDVWLALSEATQGLMFRGSWDVNPGDLLAPGDRYEFVLEREDGTRLLTLSAVVEAYENYYPNGVECGGDPCHVAMPVVTARWE